VADTDLTAAEEVSPREHFLARWESRTTPLIIIAAVLPLVGLAVLGALVASLTSFLGLEPSRANPPPPQLRSPGTGPSRVAAAADRTYGGGYGERPGAPAEAADLEELRAEIRELRSEIASLRRALP
jgi:hypothetical protein